MDREGIRIFLAVLLRFQLVSGVETSMRFPSHCTTSNLMARTRRRSPKAAQVAYVRKLAILSRERCPRVNTNLVTWDERLWIAGKFFVWAIARVSSSTRSTIRRTRYSSPTTSEYTANASTRRIWKFDPRWKIIFRGTRSRMTRAQALNPRLSGSPSDFLAHIARKLKERETDSTISTDLVQVRKINQQLFIPLLMFDSTKEIGRRDTPYNENAAARTSLSMGIPLPSRTE